jgi:hypothetical protein
MHGPSHIVTLGFVICSFYSVSARAPYICCMHGYRTRQNICPARQNKGRGIKGPMHVFKVKCIRRTTALPIRRLILQHGAMPDRFGEFISLSNRPIAPCNRSAVYIAYIYIYGYKYAGLQHRHATPNLVSGRRTTHQLGEDSLTFSVITDQPLQRY